MQKSGTSLRNLQMRVALLMAPGQPCCYQRAVQDHTIRRSSSAFHISIVKVLSAPNSLTCAGYSLHACVYIRHQTFRSFQDQDSFALFFVTCGSIAHFRGAVKRFWNRILAIRFRSLHSHLQEQHHSLVTLSETQIEYFYHLCLFASAPVVCHTYGELSSLFFGNFCMFSKTCFPRYGRTFLTNTKSQRVHKSPRHLFCRKKGVSPSEVVTLP